MTLEWFKFGDSRTDLIDKIVQIRCHESSACIAHIRFFCLIFVRDKSRAKTLVRIYLVLSFWHRLFEAHVEIFEYFIPLSLICIENIRIDILNDFSWLYDLTRICILTLKCMYSTLERHSKKSKKNETQVCLTKKSSHALFIGKGNNKSSPLCRVYVNYFLNAFFFLESVFRTGVFFCDDANAVGFWSRIMLLISSSVREAILSRSIRFPFLESL